MKNLNLSELSLLRGGEDEDDERKLTCLQELEYEANTHEDTGDEDEDKKYWDEWSKKYYECLGVEL